MAQLHCNFYSYTLGYPVDIQVTLPSFTSCNLHLPHTHTLPGKFPVLYLLHGHGNDAQVWMRYTSAERYAEEFRIAIVTFSCRNTWYQNMPHGEDYYDFLNHELPEFVESYFPVSSDAKDRYVAGLSMGGYGALVHGLQQPQRYRAIGAFSPGIHEPGTTCARNGRPILDIYEVTRTALEAQVKLPDVYLCVGDKDFLFERVQHYHETFRNQWSKTRYTYDQVPGYEHEFAFWDMELIKFLSWIPRTDVFAAMERNHV